MKRAAFLLVLLALALPAQGRLWRVDAVDGPLPDGLPGPAEAGTIFESPDELQRAGLRWLELMDRRGYPFAQLWYRPLDEGEWPDTLSVGLNLVPGPRGPLGGLRVEGGRRLSEVFLAEVTGLSGSDPFSREKALRGRDRLAATGWFRSVEDPLLAWDAVRGEVGVLYRVEERPRSNRATALFGGGSGQRQGALDLALFSPFGRGRNWSLAGTWRSGDRSEVSVDLREPRLAGWNLDLDLQLHRSLRDSTWLSQSLRLEAGSSLPAGWSAALAWGFERTLYPQSDGEMSRRSQGLVLAWRGLDPQGGGGRRLRLAGDLLWRREDGEVEKQWELEGELLWTHPLTRLFSLRLAGGGAWLEGEGPAGESERHPLGGANNLRGWNEEQFRGERVGHGSLEAVLGRDLELFLFLDYGRGRRLDAGGSDFSGWGYGLGLSAPAERGSLSLAFALGEGKRMEDLRVHLRLDAGW